MASTTQGCGEQEGAPGRHDRMALAALLLSIFAFIPPCGIAAVVMAHVASRRIAASRGVPNGAATARAAMIIAYVQMSLVAVALVLGWGVLSAILPGFRSDPLVQRVLREADARATLDDASAREQEITARGLITQLVAIQDQYHRTNGQGFLCTIGELAAAGRKVPRLRRSRPSPSACANPPTCSNCANAVGKIASPPPRSS